MHHEKYVLIAILVLSRKTARTRIGNYGDARIVGNSVARNLTTTGGRSGRSSHTGNKHMNRLHGSSDAARSGCNDS
jgi:hypothetical protein